MKRELPILIALVGLLALVFASWPSAELGDPDVRGHHAPAAPRRLLLRVPGPFGTSIVVELPRPVPIES